MKEGLRLIGYCVSAGILMGIYILIPGFSRFIFSLLAILVGMRYFRQVKRRGLRISFFFITLVCAFLFPMIYAVLADQFGWPISPKFQVEPNPV